MGEKDREMIDHYKLDLTIVIMIVSVYKNPRSPLLYGHTTRVCFPESPTVRRSIWLNST